MTKGSSRRQRQLRIVKARRARRQAELVGLAFRAMLDSKVKPTLRVSGVINDDSNAD